MTIVEYSFKDNSLNKTYSVELDTTKFFKTANEIKEYLLNNNSSIRFNKEFGDGIYNLDIKDSNNVKHFIEEIESDIATNKIPRFIMSYQVFKNKKDILNLILDLKKSCERLEQTKDDNNLVSPEKYKAFVQSYNDNYIELAQIKKDTENKSWECLKNNWVEIKEYLSTFLVDKAEQAKLRLKQSQAKYYQKKKALLGIESKPKLTAEEKAERYKEQLKKANKTYYEKKRAELIELGVMKPKQTEEEKRIAKQEANKRYYAAKKQKLEILEDDV